MKHTNHSRVSRVVSTPAVNKRKLIMYAAKHVKLEESFDISKGVTFHFFISMYSRRKNEGMNCQFLKDDQIKPLGEKEIG